MTRAGIIRLTVIAATYFLAGKFGLSLAYVNESTTAVWPPSGIAVAALLLFGRGVWPAIAAGAFFVNLTTSGSVWASLAIASGNVLEGLVAASLVTRYAMGRAAFSRTADILRFTLTAAGIATAIAATVGTAALLAAGLATVDVAPSIWLTWWLGDAVGTVAVAPLVLLWPPAFPKAWTPARTIEAFLLVVAVVGASGFVFGNTAAAALRLPLEFIAVPLLLWAAFRFGGWSTAAAAATLAAFAISGTMRGLGPFARPDPNDSLLLLQLFVGVITIVMLSVAAEVATRRRVEREMRAFNQALEERVAKRTEELRRVHGRLIEAQQVAHVGSWEWDVADNSLWWSEEMCRIYGLDGPPSSYEAYLTLVHPMDRARTHEVVHRASLDCNAFTFDQRIIRSDGAVRTLHAHGRVIAGPDGRAARMVGTGHDVTEYIAAEEQRAQLLVEQAGRRDAEKASRAKDQFLATLSHELRTPLNVAVGWSSLLESGALDHARSTAAIHTVHRNLRVLSQLVSDIIDASRITAGAFRLEPGEVDIATVVQGAVDTVRPSAESRGISIDVQPIPPGDLLNGDERRLQQVVWNLMSNAIKFGRSGGRVTLTVIRDPGSVTIEVADDGPGIPADFLPHVFDAFTQADNSPTRAQGGLGLGLSIARHLVELHGGSITAHNGPEGGAVFIVRLPVDVVARAGAPASSHTAQN